jgi:flagellar hook-associated protein 1 FlgK
MADMLTTGVSGLLAFQRALDTTSHNIANASTEGYSRQLVDLVTRPPDAFGNGWVGTGVDVATVRRQFDEILANQARVAGSGFQQLDTFSTYATRIDNLFSDANTGLATTLQGFMSAVQTVANAPASVPSRQVLLSQAQSLVDRLRSYDNSLNSISSQISSQLHSEAGTISTIAANIASVNVQIVAAQGVNQQPPNDLLDQRDKLLAQLATHVNVSTVPQSDGMLNVFIGTGQALVMGGAAAKLVTGGDQFGPTRTRLLLQSGGPTTDVTETITGGTVGGLLQFGSQMLDPARNAIGQTAVTLATLVNDQQAAGLDLQGQLGTAMFAIGAVNVLPSTLNAGTASATVTRAAVSALTTSDYQLLYDGANWQLSRVDTGAAVAMSGNGTAASPFTADGLSIVINGAPQAGDRMLIQPTRTAVAGMSVVLSQPEKVAAAAPLLTSAALANAGSASIDAGVLANPATWVRGDYTLSFTNASTWQVTNSSNAVVATGAFSAGAPIVFNGVQVVVSGTPAAGDSFQVKDNANGTGDNRNALQIAALLTRPVLNGGTVSLGDNVGRLVSNIGVQTSQAQSGRDAQQIVMNDANSAISSVAGVNLDEEAANLMRFQQAYQAAAKVIGVANALFQSLLDATR